MVYRIQKLNKNNSLFLFGARGTGKTTLLKELFNSERTLWIDLLEDSTEEQYRKRPQLLSSQIDTQKYDRVVIDEIQKNPKLLDIVHLEIEKKRGIQFVLSGSSARKLKRGGANLLGGRAFQYSLFPFTYNELGKSFDLNHCMQWGSLPKLWEFTEELEKRKYLESYVRTYLKEEILVEQIVRNIDPFRDFLEIAAQLNGKIINYSKIARDVGVDDKTVRSYYQILEETLVGFKLPSFHRSIRKQQRAAPKFYLFDVGVKRALQRTLKVPLVEKTFAFGEAFEHAVLLECFRLNEYCESDFRLSYLRTKDQLEIDLVIDRPGKPDLLVEVKSYDQVNPADASKVKNLVKDWDQEAQGEVWSRDSNTQVIGGVVCRSWQEGLAELFA